MSILAETQIKFFFYLSSSRKKLSDLVYQQHYNERQDFFFPFKRNGNKFSLYCPLLLGLCFDHLFEGCSRKLTKHDIKLHYFNEIFMKKGHARFLVAMQIKENFHFFFQIGLYLRAIVNRNKQKYEIDKQQNRSWF